MHIRLKSHLSYITVFAVCAPTNPVTSTIEASQPSDDFYNELSPAMATIPATDMVTILGDFNARIRTDTNTWHTSIGPHGVGEINRNGQSQLDFVSLTNFLLLTPSFGTSQFISILGIAMVTKQCTNPGHVIDYILVSAKHRSFLFWIRVSTGEFTIN